MMLRTAPLPRIALLAAATLLLLPSQVLQAAKPPAPAEAGQPENPKALKTFHSAEQWLRAGEPGSAISAYRKANRQDDGHCSECLQRAYLLALSINDFKGAEEIAHDLLATSAAPADQAKDHYMIGLALQRQAALNHKQQCFSQSCDEFNSAVKLSPQFPQPHFALGVSLAQLHQDDAARAEFSTFLKLDEGQPDLQSRAKRYLGDVSLARARMVPAFSITTLDGKHISMDGLAGKVILLDFWATWCGPCREALPHVRKIASEFQGPHFVVISISLDSNEAKWKEFVAKNGMTWPQYRDGGFNGPIGTLFGVNAIPATFSIDADGVVEDQHVGDADIEKTIKKLIAKAETAQPNQPQTASARSTAATPPEH